MPSDLQFSQKQSFSCWQYGSLFLRFFLSTSKIQHVNAIKGHFIFLKYVTLTLKSIEIRTTVACVSDFFKEFSVILFCTQHAQIIFSTIFLCKGKGKYTDVIIVLAAFLCTCKINYKI
jgi:hypothetical protein